MASRFILRHPLKEVPVISLLAANFGNFNNLQVVAKKEQPEAVLTLIPQGDTLTGDEVVGRYFARLKPELNLVGSDDPFEQSEVDQWIDQAVFDLVQRDPQSVLRHLNQHLQVRTFFVSSQITLADFAVYSFLKKKGIQLNEAFPHVLRWLRYVETLPPFQEVLKLFPKSEDKQKGPSAGAKGAYGELEGAEDGKVVTRFPPEPSGYLHIGHAKAALVNYQYAKKYHGKLIVRFDDTNPVKEKEEYVENILRDIQTLGIQYDKLTYTSDYFDQLLSYCEQMIKKGLAYADDTKADDLKIHREKAIESVARKQTIEENLAIWEQMKKATEKGKTYTIRAKIDMQHINKVMRDPAIYRVVDTPHHKTGTKYKVYPLYDFACPLVDSLEGVTHALRSSEYHDHNELYTWFLEKTGARMVRILDFSRLGFAYTVLSKRKLQYFVDHRIVDGWNDPCFPTVQGILRRGLTLEALTEFIISQGASKSVTNQEPEKLWAINKQFIDPVIPRYTAIPNDARVKMRLTNGPQGEELKAVAKHRKNADLGLKGVIYTSTIFIEKGDALTLAEGEEVTLMDWGNAKVQKIVREGDNVTEVVAELHLSGSAKDTSKRLTWVAEVPDLINVVLVECGNLLTKKKLEKEDDFEKFINKNPKKEILALGEAALKHVPVGQRLQLTRRGYFICDQAYLNPQKPLVLVMIPEGKEKTMSNLIDAPTTK